MKAISRKCPRCLEVKTFRADQRTCGCPKPPKPVPPPKPVQVESDERNGGERTLTKLTTERVKTLAELAEICEIDTEEWDIYKWKCTAWQTGMKPPTIGHSIIKGHSGDADLDINWRKDSKEPVYSEQFSVSAWMRLRRNVIEAKNIIEELRKKAEKFAPKYPPFILKGLKNTGVMAEVSIVDHHFGALIWPPETGGPAWDLKIATQAWKDAVSTLASRIKPYEPELITFVVGNDQQNADNRQGTTERGTPQANDSRYEKVFMTSFDSTQWAVDHLVNGFGKVRVVAVQGNHDPLSTFHLGHALSCWYNNNSNVEVDYSPNPKKYYQHGCVMLMWTHGNNGKIEEYDKTMSSEQPGMWGNTLWREAHTADKHQRRLIELKGAAVRILPSLRPPDAWSAENHFIGAMRLAESYLWSKTEALIGTACFSILDWKKSLDKASHV